MIMVFLEEFLEENQRKMYSIAIPTAVILSGDGVAVEVEQV